MKEFGISDNNFTGSIPEFIFQNWTKLEEIYIEGSGLSGPIPTIDSLENLFYIRISDLNGDGTAFPQLSNLSKLETLILRSCNLIEKLPASLLEFERLQTLDVSFNRLSEEIPADLSELKNLDYLFLTGNSFTGAVPQWIRKTKEETYRDISFNNFIRTDVSGCQESGSRYEHILI